MPSELSVVEAVGGVLAPYRGWWAVAGGWATDLWLGEVSRDHHDIEVSCLRPDAEDLWEFLRSTGAELAVIDPPGSGWRAWGRGQRVSPPAFQLQASVGELTFDLFLETTDGAEWVFRRDPRIRRPLTSITWQESKVPAPALRPEVQLLYMAKSEDPKNEHDFGLVLPTLGSAEREWLRGSLATAHPGHRWLSRLEAS